MTAPWTADEVREVITALESYTACAPNCECEGRKGVEMLRDYADLLDQPAWRPIDSAPKDGYVLAWWPYLDECRPVIAWRECVSAQSSWATDGHVQHGSDPGPTHWQPLPTPTFNTEGREPVTRRYTAEELAREADGLANPVGVRLNLTTIEQMLRQAAEAEGENCETCSFSRLGDRNIPSGFRECFNPDIERGSTAVPLHVNGRPFGCAGWTRKDT
jgi:hypothetical protein